MANVEEPQSVNDEVLVRLVRGPTAGPLVLCSSAVRECMGRSLAPGTVRLPALISGVSSTTLPTLGADGFIVTIEVVGFVAIGVSLTISTVVVVVVVVVLLRVWPLPFSSVCRAIEVSPSMLRSPWTG